MSAGQWLPLVGLTLSAFIFNTSEFMPIGLLTDIAVDLHVTEARAGMLISVYAWVVALLSLPLMLLVARMEYRRLLLVTLALFIVSHLLSAVAGSYAVLMASRIGVACSHAVFWSIASPLAVRIVPEKRRSLALSMIVTGTSVAMVVGMSVGVPLFSVSPCSLPLSFAICLPFFRRFPEASLSPYAGFPYC